MSLWFAVLILFSIIVGAIGIFGIVNRERAGVSRTKVHMKGKTVLITGASSGIGKEAAKLLAKKGARLILACRNITKGNATAGEIRSMTRNEEVLAMELDTSSLDSVRSFTHKFLDQESRLDVLILNAGMFGTMTRQVTSDGLEKCMATNHFGHFLLANLLLGVLLDSTPSRIVVTSSSLHNLINELEPSDLNFEKGGFSQFRSYGQSKACNILFARHLAQIAKDTGLVVNAFCPGLVSTEHFKKTEGTLISKLKVLLVPFIGRTPWQGAQSIIHLAASEEVAQISGQFFENCQVSDNTSDIVNEREVAEQVWDESERLVKLQPEEKFY